MSNNVLYCLLTLADLGVRGERRRWGGPLLVEQLLGQGTHCSLSLPGGKGWGRGWGPAGQLSCLLDFEGLSPSPGNS